MTAACVVRVVALRAAVHRRDERTSRGDTLVTKTRTAAPLNKNRKHKRLVSVSVARSAPPPNAAGDDDIDSVGDDDPTLLASYFSPAPPSPPPSPPLIDRLPAVSSDGVFESSSSASSDSRSSDSDSSSSSATSQSLVGNFDVDDALSAWILARFAFIWVVFGYLTGRGGRRGCGIRERVASKSCFVHL